MKRNKIIKHYKSFFGLEDVGLGEDDHLIIDFAEDLVKNRNLQNVTIPVKIIWEYSIIPVSFKDYNEYLDCLNDYGKEGWQFGVMIRTYEDSPEKGITTHDYVCKRVK